MCDTQFRGIDWAIKIYCQNICLAIPFQMAAYKYNWLISNLNPPLISFL